MKFWGAGPKLDEARDVDSKFRSTLSGTRSREAWSGKMSSYFGWGATATAAAECAAKMAQDLAGIQPALRPVVSPIQRIQRIILHVWCITQLQLQS